jgi:2-haloacid dehalogenase
LRQYLGFSEDLAQRGLEKFGELETKHQQMKPKLLYPQILEDVVKEIGVYFGRELTQEQASAFAKSIREWPPFPDTTAALQYLQQHYKLVIISNVDNDSFEYSRQKIGIDFDLICTAQDIGDWKPSLINFNYAISRVETQWGYKKNQILHVFQSLYHDFVPAKQIGLATVWIDRRHGKQGSGATPITSLLNNASPDWTFKSLAEFVDYHKQVLGPVE